MPIAEFVQNPKTGKFVKVGGPTYLTLQHEGIDMSSMPHERKQAPHKTNLGQPISKASLKKTISMRERTKPTLAATLRTTSQPAKRQRLIQEMAKEKDGRGSRTRGWVAPQRGQEREALLKRCGPKCFLREGTAFPVCSAKPKNCELDCAGLASAKVRAAQWGYNDVLEAVKRIEQAGKCKKR